MAQEWSCPNCGKQNPPQLSACGWCRFAPVGLEPSAPVLEVKTPQGQAAPLASASPAAASAAPGSFRCSHCGDPGAQRVSGIVRQDIRTESTTGAYLGGSYAGGFGVHAGSVSTQTESASTLALLLVPPPMPERGESAIFGVAGWACVLVGAPFWALLVYGLFCLAAGRPDTVEGLKSIAPAAILTAVGAASCFSLHRTAHSELQTRLDRETAGWKRQLHVWQRLNYCRRCDSVSDPDTGQHAPSSAWRPLLGK